MESEIEENNESGEQGNETPLCLNCLKPVDPLYHYCPHCGRAVGQFTPIMPYESIIWQADIWGRMWRQMWSREISFTGRLFRLFMIIWWAPVMLLGLIPKLWQRIKTDSDTECEHDFSGRDNKDKEGL